MLNRLDLRGLKSNIADRLPRPELKSDGPIAVVREIIADVRAGGDQVLLSLTERFDGVELDSPRVSQSAMDRAVEELDTDLRLAIEASIANVEAFHKHQLRPPELIESPGVVVEAYQKPVRRAGLYAPGGRAEYPSTVIMTAMVAKVAGVAEIALCVPPTAGLGTVAPTVLAAARLCGVSEVYAVGGAQAIAAMAYGTESIPPVDVIAGPGNIYVALAKQLVAGDVGIAAAFAGPSEVVVVADDSAVADYAAIDLMVQAEHGPDGLAWLVTWDEAVADAVSQALERMVAVAPRGGEITATFNSSGYVALVDDRPAALAVIDAIAPEHLELQVSDAAEMGRLVNNAGAIFCGNLAPASLGDYMVGPSHVLPTYGSARFASALTVADFQRDHHLITIGSEGIKRLGPATMTLATQEGLHAHAESIRIRLDSADLDSGSSSSGSLAAD